MFSQACSFTGEKDHTGLGALKNRIRLGAFRLPHRTTWRLRRNLQITDLNDESLALPVLPAWL
jgi:hypothetical protein